MSQTRRRVGSERKDTGSATIGSMSSGASWLDLDRLQEAIIETDGKARE